MRAVGNFNLTGRASRSACTARASRRICSVLRVSPLLGRTFTEEEDEIGRERVVLLGYFSGGALWGRPHRGRPRGSPQRQPYRSWASWAAISATRRGVSNLGPPHDQPRRLPVTA